MSETTNMIIIVIIMIFLLCIGELKINGFALSMIIMRIIIIRFVSEITIFAFIINPISTLIFSIFMQKIFS